jgi:hypothetical protein
MKTLTYPALAIALWVLPFVKLHAQYTGQLTFSSSEISFSQSDGWDVVTMAGPCSRASYFLTRAGNAQLNK